MAQALGAEFLDGDGRPVAPGRAYLTGGDLEQVPGLKLDKVEERTRGVTIAALCDTTLTSRQMYSPTNHKISRRFDQSREDIIRRLDAAILRYCRVIERTAAARRKNRWIGDDLAREPFFGAAVHIWHRPFSP